MNDPKLILGALFIACYYGTLWVIGFRLMPPDNVGLIKDAMLQLGPPIGIIIGALFRTDRLDEKRAETTQTALQGAREAVAAVTAQNAPNVMLKPGETAQAEEPLP